MPERRTGQVPGAKAGLMLMGLLLGVAGGWVAGLVRVPQATEGGR